MRTDHVLTLWRRRVLALHYRIALRERDQVRVARTGGAGVA
ncbi:MAG: hypothetical protein VYC34_02775 [Planctomycetota bacterium]|nr:hypothetical protein [Planctomycetota bacterium]